MPHRGGQGALLALLLLLPAAAAQLGLNEERAERERRVDCSVTCPHRSREPVCGTNGRTYSSLCDLDLAICRKVKVSLKHEGECTLEEKCMDERRARQEQIANGERVYVPNCQEDGSYAPLQCHNFTRYCWCSSLDGIPIQETVQSGTLPTCPDRHREAPRTTAPPAGAGKSGKEVVSNPAREESLNTLLSLSTATPAGRPNKPPRRGPKRCTGRARRSFITRLTNKLVTEYQRVRNTKKLSERKLHRRVVKWKFSELDRNNDRKLQRREYKRLRKTVRKFIKPKKCAKMFPRMCDANGDRSLTEQEWVTCFNRQGDKDRQRDDRCPMPPCNNRPTTPKPSVPSCEHERSRHGLMEGDHTNMSIPVYKCQPNGRYEPMQCFKADSTDVICICVDEWTGNSLDGTGVRNGTPDCSRPMPHARVWPGCTGEVKTKFMQDLKKFLFSKVEGGDRNPGADSSTQSVEEFAARYHFGSLDTNNSSFLEGREKKMVKRHFKSNPKLKRCGRKMTIYCDVNYDKRVSLEEWVACVTVEQNDTGNSAGGVSVRTIDENPLHKYLVPEDGEVYRKSRNH
ncbi:SPARC-related modular calcium-binding protein 1-like isoform X3 [Portunus trituberculatus]|uniref:SPARC-related modular calcium-binding protein 1-like isoform X3 n=1 Tax=Portunus trituberculatus TaxID=210409 RepID=UPI001E1CB08E|nr:SPARC-related modular calcium-binding protein 1-like isoform X3 [Portunus trituberculatus]